MSDIATIDAIILISSPSHMRRATMVFRRTFRKGVLHTPNGRRTSIDCQIIPQPTSYGNFQPRGWYRDRESAKDVLYGYIKIAGWLAGIK